MLLLNVRSNRVDTYRSVCARGTALEWPRSVIRQFNGVNPGGWWVATTPDFGVGIVGSP